MAAAHRRRPHPRGPASGRAGLSGPAPRPLRRACPLCQRRHPARPDHRGMTESTDLLVIGAGPCGLAVGVAAKQTDVPCVLVDRRTIVSTIERYPLGMTFFSTPERIEIGGIPFIASHEKPTRKDGLIYYRRVAEHYGLDIRPGEDVTDVRREPDGGFTVEVRRAHDRKAYHAAAVVFATGYFDNPNYLN